MGLEGAKMGEGAPEDGSRSRVEEVKDRKAAQAVGLEISWLGHYKSYY